MPKRAYLAPYLSSDELKDNYRKAKESVEARRWHFLWKVALGWSVENSALAVGISISYGWKILKNYHEKGKQGVQNQKKKSHEHSRGSKPLLDDQQFLKLTQVLLHRPPDGGVWTGAKVARWIERETGVEKVWNLHRMGLPKKVRLFLAETET